MVQRRLNLAALRASASTAGLPPVSRRALLGLAAGGAAIGALPPGSRRVGLRREGHAVVWMIGDQPVWTLDPAAFDGRPRLALDGGRVALRGARWPGTLLSADAEFELSPDGSVAARFELAGVTAAGDAVEWLTGARPLRAEARFADVVVPGLAELSGPAVVAIAPTEWTCVGPELARVACDGLLLAADTVSFGPAAGDSLLSPAPARRTRLSLDRGSRRWPVAVPIAGHAWRFEAEEEPFDQLDVELADGAAALLFSGDARPMALAIDGLTGDAGSRGTLRLLSPRYVRSLTGDQASSALVATVDPAPTGVWSGGARLELRGDDRRPLEAVALPGAPAELRCEPSLTGLGVPLDGALVEAVLPADGLPLPLTEEDDARPHLRLTKAPVEIGKALRPAPPGQVGRPPNLPVFALPNLIVTRPDDLLRLEFSFHNLRLQTAPDLRLVRRDSAQPAHIVVHFPAQHLGEETFPEPPDTAPAKAPPVGALLAGESRLAFLIPAEVDHVPFTLAALLDWAAWRPSLVPVALPPAEPLVVQPPADGPITAGIAVPPPADVSIIPPDLDPTDDDPIARRRRPGGRLGRPTRGIVLRQVDLGPLRDLVRVTPRIAEPDAVSTALELPYRLVLSPHALSGWAHVTEPVTVEGRTELWHTRLGVRTADGISEAPHRLRAVRCVWSPDYRPRVSQSTTWPNPPFDMPMLAKDRHQLVRLTSDFLIENYTPPTVGVQRLMLTGLGGWLTCRGTFNPPAEQAPELSLSEWKHEATMGRDQFVKLVYEGYLFPFGHRCIKTVISERKVVARRGYASVAYLRKRMFLTVLEPTRSYPSAGMPFSGRGLPFRRIEIVTRDTPNLDLPVPGAQRLIGLGESCFWPTVGGQDFQFLAVGEDHDGERVEFSAPLVWIELGPAINETLMQQLSVAYEQTTPPARLKRPLDGQMIALAPSKEPGDTCVEAVDLSFGAGATDGGAAGKQPRFYCRMTRATVRHPAVKAVAGARSTVDVAYWAQYLSEAFGAGNQVEAFCGLAEGAQPVQINLPTTRSGVAAPGCSVGGLSRLLGPTGGDVAKLAGGTFDPAEFLGSGVSLLGGINLVDVVAPVFGLNGTVPKLVHGFAYDNPGAPTEPTAITASYTFKPKLADWPPGAPIFDTIGGKATCELTTTVVTPLTPGAEPLITVSGRIEQFRLRLLAGLFDLAEVTFSVFAFDGATGRPFDCRPKVSGLKFLGPLKYCEKLLSQAGPLLAGTPGTKSAGAGLGVQPILELDTEHVAVGATLALPTLAMGAFTLQNLSALAKVNVPFDGDAVTLTTQFAEREAPFLLSLTIFGGGGFFGLVLDTSEVRQLEASLEFGAVVALSLGVAAGSAKAVGGVYFKWVSDEVELTGFVKLSGCLKVLGLVTVSCTFNLSLTYKSAGNQVTGQAKLTVEVEIGFFSKSVSMKVERQFAGESTTAALPNAPRRYAALPGSKSAGPATGFESVMSRAQWESYCAKFAV